MPMKAMIRTPRDTPTATPILIPSLDSGDALLVRLERGSVVERVLVEEGPVDVEEVSVDDSENSDGLAVGDTVSVTVSVILSVVLSVVLSVSVCISVSFFMVLCELTLIKLDR